MRQLRGRIGAAFAFSLVVHVRHERDAPMKRLLLPLLAAGTAAAVIGGTSAGAHPSAGARTAKAATIQLKKVSKVGKVLVNGQGVTLYLFEKDKHGKSSCNGACAAAWPPALTSGKPKAGKGVSSSKLGAVKRRDGKKQATYNGHPLYTYVGDSGPGTASGEGSNAYGAKWYVVNAKGKKVDKD
jgi:predicted lipoprotein with Yx(FWY)xxD motif